MTMMSITSTMNMSLFTFTIMAIAIRAFDNTSRAFGVMAVAMPVAVVGFGRLDINGHKNGHQRQQCQIGFHV